MKIGLLTLPIETGYGSIMQAFALKTALCNRGHEVVLLRRLRKKRKYDIIRIIRRCVKKFILGKWDTIIFIDRKELLEYPIVTQNTQKFVDYYMQPYSPKFFSSKSMVGISNLNLDAIVVGSDQVWRPGCMDRIEDFFLCPIETLPIKKYAYAASFGIDEWIYSEKETRNCKRAVQTFDRISVREKSGVYLCDKYFGKKADFVLDPTLLFDKSFYTSLVGGNHDLTKEHKICAFVLDRTSEKQSILLKLSRMYNKKYFFASNNTENRQAHLQDRIAPSVESWLDSFDSADVIFTDSFHGCAFSIIFRKDFYVYVNKGRGAGRFKSLLGLFGLEHRVVDENTELSLVQPIDWSLVEEKLNQMQQVSNSFIDAIS